VRGETTTVVCNNSRSTGAMKVTKNGGGKPASKCEHIATIHPKNAPLQGKIKTKE